MSEVDHKTGHRKRLHLSSPRRRGSIPLYCLVSAFVLIATLMFSGAAHASLGPDDNLIIPGERVDMITKDTTEAELIAKLGKGNVRRVVDDTWGDGERRCVTWVFPNQDKELVIFWKEWQSDYMNESEIKSCFMVPAFQKIESIMLQSAKYHYIYERELLYKKMKEKNKYAAATELQLITKVNELQHKDTKKRYYHMANGIGLNSTLLEFEQKNKSSIELDLEGDGAGEYDDSSLKIKTRFSLDALFSKKFESYFKRAGLYYLIDAADTMNSKQIPNYIKNEINIDLILVKFTQ